MFSDIVAALLPVFGIIFLGAFVARRGVLPQGTAMCLSLYVYWVALPAMMFNYIARISPETYTGPFFAGIYTSTVFSYLVCLAATSSFFRKNMREATMLTWMSCFPNVAFMGIAVIVLLLPGNQEALAAVTMYSILNTPFMLYTDTRLALSARDTDRHNGESPSRVFLALLLMMLRNPMLMGSLAGLLVSLFYISMPAPVMNMASMLGATAAPCAIFGMGMSLSLQLAAVGRFPGGWLRRQFPVHPVKTLILPASTYIALRCFGVEGVTLGAATLAACMPVGVAAYVVAEKFGVLPQDTSLGIFISTALSMLVIPLVIAAMFWLGAF